MIKHNKTYLYQNYNKLIESVLKSNILINGKFINSFEEKIGNYFDLTEKNVACCSSGYAALVLSTKVLFKKKSLIQIPNYGCSSIYQSTQLNNFQIKLIDNKKNMYHASIEKIKKNQSKNLIFPYYFGIPTNLNSIKGKNIIEDCSQAFGAKINNQFVGTLYSAGIFSFGATKLFTSGGNGGAVISKDKKLIKEIKDIRDYDLKPISKLRYNFSLNEINSIIGISQLKNFNKIKRKRKILLNQYIKNGINILVSNNKNIESANYRAVHITKNPKKIIKYLSNYNISSIIPYEKKELISTSSNMKNSISFSLKTISLPLHLHLTLNDIDYVSECIKKYYTIFPDDIIN